MKQGFSADFFAGNRQRLRERLSTDAPIVLTANGLLQRGADSAFPFAQDANFWYLTGIDEADITCVIDGDKDFLIVPGREGSREAFDGAIDASDLTAISGIITTYDDARGWKRLDALLQKHAKVATLAAAPNYLQQYGMYTNPSRSRVIERMQQHVEGLEIIDIRTELAGLRMIKQPLELKALQRAIDITIDSLEEAGDSRRLKRYDREYEIEAELSRGFRTRAASGHAFEPIVASGARACTLHNISNDGELKSGELIVIDIGAEYSHYAADITRTISYGKPTDRQRSVYNAVLDVQAFALDLLKPGTDLRKYEQKVERYMGKQLKQLGLIKKLDHDAIRHYYPHATSHFLGLNVHDVGDYTQPLQAGTVLTCEPGIYIPEEGIGVRIEDDVLITPKGHRVLSDRLPKTLTLTYNKQ